MKQIISYVAGGLLVGWAGYIFISTDPAVRTTRACMPLGGSVRIMGAIVRALDEDTGRDLADEALPVIQTCRQSVWYWAYPDQSLPDFSDQDAVLGDYRPRGTRDAPKDTGGKHAHGDDPASAPAASSVVGQTSDDDRL